MSWANELKPPGLSARTIWSELKPAWKAYADVQMPLAQRLVFLCLRIVQMCSYNIGWQAGARAMKKPK